jgi:hypothetical protein
MGDYYGHYLMALERIRRTHEDADRERLVALATRPLPARKDFAVAGQARPTVAAPSRTR